MVQSRSLLGIVIVRERSSRLGATRQTGMDRQTLRDRVHRCKEASGSGPVSPSTPGLMSKLSQAQLPQPCEWVVASSGAAVCPVVRRRCVDLRDEVSPQSCRDHERAHDRQVATQAEADTAFIASLSCWEEFKS